MSIKLYKASNFAHTPFETKEDLDYLAQHNIRITPNIGDADIVISQNYKHLKKHLWRSFFNKKFLIWTLEPRFDTHFENQFPIKFGKGHCQVMNIYTGNVFCSNVSFNCFHINKTLEPLAKDFRLPSKKIIALMSYYLGVETPPLNYRGHNIDLIGLRSKIALKGHERGAMDVYGKGWPMGISKEDSREGAFWERKRQLLGDYPFNLCFENTAFPNYMTEKIWESIENYCLPIYYGEHTNAYELFPQHSFIDYSQFENPDELFDFIDGMSDSEYISRMNKCIDVYMKISKNAEEQAKEERRTVLKAIIATVNDMKHA